MGDSYRPHTAYRERDYVDQRNRHSLAPRHRDEAYYDSRRHDHSYSFRGNAGSDSYPSPQRDFTFRLHHAPRAPQFPPEPRYDHNPRRLPHHHPDADRLDELTRSGQSQRPPRKKRSGNSAGFHARGGHRLRPAHTRDILKNARRETTPEQLEGMNVARQARFREIVDSSDESDEVVDLTRGTDEEPDDDAPRKRAKIAMRSTDATPKWSNPDPYTALPPAESTGMPKKDIVQVIRKAKLDAVPQSSSTNAVAANADFISFDADDDNDVQDDHLTEYSDASVGEKLSSNRRNEMHLSERVGFSPSVTSEAKLSDQRNGASKAVEKLLGDFQVQSEDGGPDAPPRGLVIPSDTEIEQMLVEDSKGKKRRRDNDHDDRVGRIIEEWQSNGANPTPWCMKDYSNFPSTGVRLHEEIRDFYDFVRPYDYEERGRRDIIDRIHSAVQSVRGLGGSAPEVHCFGSFAAGLYLPTADMDLVALSSEFLHKGQRVFCQTGTRMRRLAGHLANYGIIPPGGFAVVPRAKVPLLKFAEMQTGIHVDISFENDSGLIANKTFQKWRQQFPAMPVIVVLIKQILAMRGLNQVFTGGIGGFTIICLVVSMMQLMPEIQSGAMDPQQHYGDLLLHFLDLYGNKFDHRTVGIVMNPPGYFNKIQNPHVKQNDDRLTIIDPNRSDNDISGGSHKIRDVLAIFRSAYAELQRKLVAIDRGQDLDNSVLGCVLGGNYASFIRQRERMKYLYERAIDGVPPPPPPPPPQPRPQHQDWDGQKGIPPRPVISQPQLQSWDRHSNLLPPLPADSDDAGTAYQLPPVPPRSRSQRAAHDTGQKSSSRSGHKESGLHYRQHQRAVEFKRKHPECEDVPDRMSRGQVKKFTEMLRERRLTAGRKN